MRMQDERNVTQGITQEANVVMTGMEAGPAKDAIQSKYQDLLAERIAQVRESVENIRKLDEEQMPRRYREAIEVWAFLTFGSYAIGWIGVWVYRGFRPSRSEG